MMNETEQESWLQYNVILFTNSMFLLGVSVILMLFQFVTVKILKRCYAKKLAKGKHMADLLSLFNKIYGYTVFASLFWILSGFVDENTIQTPCDPFACLFVNPVASVVANLVILALLMHVMLGLFSWQWTAFSTIVYAVYIEWKQGKAADVIIRADGSQYKGECTADGVPNGYGRIFFVDGSVYIGNVRNDKLSGLGKMIYANGDVYEGNWKDNKRHGRGRQVYAERVEESVDEKA